ncbi:MAG: YggS family pyridoxal phosphate-dependent enzyme [Gammaproteobacteria bacterium]|nr:YggS family pyridoxal phosphate-dependent enzyme [Gammaproteobacteria bacterium]
MDKIGKNILKIKQDIKAAEKKFNRDSNSVLLMAVSKTQSVENILKAYEAGQRDFGENYVQESIEKIVELKNLDITWHFIGKIQSNKSKYIAENFDWIHSIDKISTLKKINDLRKNVEEKLNVCVQVNIDSEDSKSGILVNEVEDFIVKASKFEKLKIRGLMAIPMYHPDYVSQYKTFAKIKNLFDSLIKKNFKLDTLSIGMSSDYNAAIEAGSTIVRIGTSIFGERKK